MSEEDSEPMDFEEVEGVGTPPQEFRALRDIIVERRDKLPRRLTQVAAYAVESPDEIAFGTVASIATAAKVQPSTLVRFAKAMIIHHEGALDMANAYLADPDANNGYLKLMSLDILRDQRMEIDLMKSIIGKYAGNPDDVKIDPSMVHGMDHMMHGSAPQPTPEKNQHHH